MRSPIASFFFAATAFFAVLVVAPHKAAAADNLMPNPSLETAASGEDRPASWFRGGWGTNTATLSYSTDAHSGSRSVRVDMTSYSSGDAKWYAISAPVTAGQTYEYGDYYKSNVATEIGLQVEKSDGSYAYLNFASVAPSTSWAHYSGSITMPTGAVRVSIFHIIAGVGYLVTDDYNFTSGVVTPPPPPSTFNRAVVSLTFDDGWESMYTNAFPIFSKYQVPTTQYIVSGFLNQYPYLSTSQLTALYNGGHEVASHTVTHTSLIGLTNRKLNNELRNSQSFLQKLYGPVTDFASPYGDYNDRVVTAIKQYYKSHRTVDRGYNTKDGFDPYRLKIQHVFLNTQNSEIQQWLNEAQQQKAWLILVWHQVDNEGSEYSVTPTQLDSELQVIKNSGLPIKTVRNALAEVQAQL